MNRELLYILFSIHNTIGDYTPTHERLAVLRLVLGYAYEDTLEAIFIEV